VPTKEWTRDSVARALGYDQSGAYEEAAQQYNAVVLRPLVGEARHGKDPNRCSGRTTKMLCAALAAALNGAFQVFIVMDGDNVTDIYWQRSYEQLVALSGVDENDAKAVKEWNDILQFAGDMAVGIRRWQLAKAHYTTSQKSSESKTPPVLFIDHALAQRRIEEAQAIIWSMRDTLEMDGKVLDLCGGRYYLLTGHGEDSA